MLIKSLFDICADCRVQRFDHKTLLNFSKVKEGHSKVNKLKHATLKMQNYLTKNDVTLKKDECQMIFKIRSGVTEVKMNQKWKYDSYECDGCEKHEETQEHVLHCDALSEMKNEQQDNDGIQYENVMNGKVDDQAKVVKLYMKQIEMLEKIRRDKN